MPVTQMNTDLMTEDLKKKRSSDQSFWLVGQPDVELIRDGRSKPQGLVRSKFFDQVRVDLCPQRFRQLVPAVLFAAHGEEYLLGHNGFDYYDVKKGTVESGSTSRIAMWMLDTDFRLSIPRSSMIFTAIME